MPKPGDFALDFVRSHKEEDMQPFLKESDDLARVVLPAVEDFFLLTVEMSKSHTPVSPKNMQRFLKSMARCIFYLGCKAGVERERREDQIAHLFSQEGGEPA